MRASTSPSQLCQPWTRSCAKCRAVVSMRSLRLSQLAIGQQRPQFLTASCLHMHRTVKPRPHHLRNTARIVAVRLVDLCLSTTCMCRVSTQITGNPASARTLNSHCDSRPASNPTRLKRKARFSAPPTTLQIRSPPLLRKRSAASSTMQMLVSLTKTSSPAK